MNMEESLAWLRAPETQPALGDLLCGLIRDIRLILGHSALGPAAKLGAIPETVDQLAPPPGPAASGAQAAASVVALLARNTGPATILFEQLTGEQVRIELPGCADRPLTAAECRDLRIGAGASGYERTGSLRTVSSGLVVAEVSSLVVPGRLPASARTALGMPGAGEPTPPPSDVPLGKALAGFGVRREPLGARLGGDRAAIAGSGVSVASSARMWLADVPVALASERGTAELCQRAGGRPGASRGGPRPRSTTSAGPLPAERAEQQLVTLVVDDDGAVPLQGAGAEGAVGNEEIGDAPARLGGQRESADGPVAGGVVAHRPGAPGPRIGLGGDGGGLGQVGLLDERGGEGGALRARVEQQPSARVPGRHRHQLV